MDHYNSNVSGSVPTKSHERNLHMQAESYDVFISQVHPSLLFSSLNFSASINPQVLKLSDRAGLLEDAFSLSRSVVS